MNRFLEKSKSLTGLFSASFLSLDRASAQSIQIILGDSWITTEEIMSIASFFGTILATILIPVAVLVWYHKRGGKKKWPSVVMWTLIILFLLVVIVINF
jgi:hypothetical protein